MARIRSVKPEFCHSEAIVGLPRDVRLHFILLWTYADDFGRGKDEPRIIKGAIWPMDDDVTADMVADWQDQLHKAGRITRYEVDGRRFFVITNWMEHQKPNRRTDSKLPGPDQGIQVDAVQAQCKSSADAVQMQRDCPAVVVGGDVEVEGEVVGDHRPEPCTALALVTDDLPTATPPNSPYPADFEEWWQVYPRKTGKGAAAKAYRKARRQIPSGSLLAALDLHAAAWATVDEQFIPHPATWLNEARYDDPAPTRRTAVRRVDTRAARNDAAIAEGLAKLQAREVGQ